MNNHEPINNSYLISSKIVRAIRAVIGEKKNTLHEPTFKGKEWEYVKDCLDSGFVSSVGQYVEKFENKITEYTGARFAVAVVNGTAALHLGLIVAGVKFDDEVLVPSLTFVATANAVSYIGAKPHFVDINAKDLGIDAKKLTAYLKEISEIKNGFCVNKKTGRVIRAIVPMHVFGHPCNLKELLPLCNKFKIKVVEDAAEALGSFYDKKHTGTFGNLGVISFNGNKTITTGGGGVILTDDIEVATHAKHLSTTAKSNHPFDYIHTEIGFNYRMPNLNAALGCAQLEQLPELLNSKRRLYRAYSKAFSEISEVSLFQEPPLCQSNYWLQTLLLNEEFISCRKEIIENCIEDGISTRPVWKPLHKLSMYENSPASSLPITNNLSERIINIPSSAGLV